MKKVLFILSITYCGFVSGMIAQSDSIPRLERMLVDKILSEGVGSRFVISPITPTHDQRGSLSIRNITIGGEKLIQGELEFPGDVIPVVNMRPSQWGNECVHRFIDTVKLSYDNINYTFVGEGDKSSRLTFVLLKNLGYVYLRGKGRVILNDNKQVMLGYGSREISSRDSVSTTPSESYSSHDYGFSFTIPTGLKLYTVDNPGPLRSQLSSLDPFILVNSQFTEENVNVKVSEPMTENDLRDFKKKLDESSNYPVPGYKKISVTFIKIGTARNRMAVEHVFYMKGNIMGKLRQVTFVHKRKGFIWTCATAINRFDKANQQFFDPLFSSMDFK